MVGLTKKFIHTDTRSPVKSYREFLVPDYLKIEGGFIGLNTLRNYDSGIIVYTGVDLDTEEILSMIEKKISLDEIQKERYRKLLLDLLMQVKDITIGKKVRVTNNFKIVEY